MLLLNLAIETTALSLYMILFCRIPSLVATMNPGLVSRADVFIAKLVHENTSLLFLTVSATCYCNHDSDLRSVSATERHDGIFFRVVRTGSTSYRRKSIKIMQPIRQDQPKMVLTPDISGAKAFILAA